MAQPAARLGDMRAGACYNSTCVSGTAFTVITNGRPTAVTGSFWGVTVIPNVCGPLFHYATSAGSTVICNGRPAVRIGDPAVAGAVCTGSFNVMM
jgi:uncharacterized Zn-binding protein involved in type VI secretion